MPTYDYECQGCGYRFELFQKMTSDPVENCPKCQGRLKRLIGNGAGIIFKGSGFYETDYKKRQKKEESKDKKPSACPMQKDCRECSASKE